MLVEPVDGTGPLESSLERQAVEALRAWYPEVRRIPEGTRDDGRSGSLAGLVRWYASVADDPRCTEPAPRDGLDALTDELTDPQPRQRLGELARFRWAVRVAEELVAWRGCRVGDGPRDHVEARVARSRLELTLGTARIQFVQPEAG